MEQLNEFMNDVIFLKEYVVFEREEDVWGVEDGSIDKMDSVGREEGEIYMVRMKRESGSRLGGGSNGGGQEGHIDEKDG